MVKRRKMVIGLLLMLLMLTSGCRFDSSKLLQKSEPPKLMKVLICFSNGDKLTGYIRNLGVEEESGQVYVGGSSLNHLYDKNGQIIGSYNYHGVLYIKILPK